MLTTGMISHLAQAFLAAPCGCRQRQQRGQQVSLQNSLPSRLLLVQLQGRFHQPQSLPLLPQQPHHCVLRRL